MLKYDISILKPIKIVVEIQTFNQKNSSKNLFKPLYVM